MQNEVIQEIESDLKRFYKRVITYINITGALVHTHLFLVWQQEEEIWIINDLKKKYGDNYYIMSIVGSMIMVIRTRYSKFDSGDDNDVDTAIKLYNLYGPAFERYRQKKIQGKVNSNTFEYRPVYNPMQAFTELAARGFMHQSLAQFDPEKYHLQWLAFNLVYPEQWDTFEEAVKYQRALGVEGYTGIHTPKRK